MTSLLISNLSDFEGNEQNLGKFLSEDLSYKILNSSKEINLIDRSKLDKLIREQNLSAAGLLDQETIVGLGEMIGIEAIVTGKYQVSGDNVKIWIRVIDIEKGVLLLSEKGNIAIEKDLKEIIESDNSWW